MPIDKINLEELKAIDFTKTALADIKQEIIDYITDHPTYSDLWDNFYDSDSGKMILDTFAFIMRKLMIRIDLLANEAYPATAQQDNSIIKVLKLIGYELRSYTQAEVFINVGFPQGRPPAEIDFGTEYPLAATDLNGSNINFYMRSDGPTDYFNSVKVQLDIDGKAKTGLILKAYSGELRIENIDRGDIVSQDGEIYTLNETPVVQDSIRVFYFDASGVKQEAVETDSFFNVPQNVDYITFIPHFDEFRGAYIEFGDSDIVNILPDYKDLQIYYCVGGGSTHNIIENSIATTEVIVVPTLVTNQDVTVNLNNPGKGFGGQDPETVDEAKRTAPLSLRTVNRAVTEEDYAILLLKQGSVLHSQVLSPNDNRDYFPAEAKIPLFHVWIYVTLNKTIDAMDDLLLMKQVNEVGTLIGGDTYDILDYLNERRIVGIENVIKPTKYTRVFFNMTIEHGSFAVPEDVESLAREELNELYNIQNTGYWKKIRLNDIISKIKENVPGVLDVTIDKFRVKQYDQILDTVSSPYYFRFLNDNPGYIEVKDDTTLLPTNYESTFDEVTFLLDSFNDVQITKVAVSATE